MLPSLRPEDAQRLEDGEESDDSALLGGEEEGDRLLGGGGRQEEDDFFLTGLLTMQASKLIPCSTDFSHTLWSIS